MRIHGKSRISEIVVHDDEEAMVLKCLQDLYQKINFDCFQNFCSRFQKANCFQV